MAIVFEERGKRLALDILGYQFPEFSKSDDDYDANWLKDSIEYADGEISFRQSDFYCLLSVELKELTGMIDGMTKVIYDTSGWNDVDICQGMTRQELAGLNAQFKALYEKYPYRNTGK